jgi:hypothetical protein
MQALEQSNTRAADLHWLAFLLMGDREPSLDVTIEAATLEAATVEALDAGDGVNPFFSNWMLRWSRKVVISKALAAIREELMASARRMGSKRVKKSQFLTRDWALDGDTTKFQLERALLAIDMFPRCALLLTVFEGLSLDDAAILLDAGRDLVEKARIAGLQELTRNLARMQGWTSTPAMACVMTSGMQHA